MSASSSSALTGKLSTSSLTTSIKIRVACITGDLDTLKEMVAEDPSIVNICLEYGKTPLSIAAGWGHEELCQFLIQHKADVNHADDIGWTPLHWSAFTGKISVCRLLLASGADPSIENKAHQTALDFEKAAELKAEVERDLETERSMAEEK
ncbi:putative tankyrase [Monocercomonoides exilis]|uniref:putative tankyrase n=1 Tax=Monocercomonoides exilis TaxID=2049356 RepID=UPI00355A15C3|nr:putative tankyrase [Monocercomonoides exilis]|eukprot:MONOS_5513.1-p1 / transcript=MONOS_5513.1 / gene=MONOS_5513 / organism=Monocercomonoides_exilis_PA203 / gene_product=unspecified product / transcript_product=unspecified product / location=Mono_scaffold00161:96020-96650(+) / protein_length=150 / sequence_SO=supercontig / SO=protein_coding / is_pseudo=false